MTDVIRQSIDNLHDDITKVVVEAQKGGHYGKVLRVIDPAPGIWQGDPVEGLVDVVYECPGGCGWPKREADGHEHHALFGPTDEKERQPGEVVDHYSLYAD